MHLQVRMHMGKLEQPNQLYLKEVGSLNVGAPAHLSMRAHVPPYPVRVGPANLSPNVVPGSFIAWAHVTA